MGRLNYIEIAKEKVAPFKNVVISETKNKEGNTTGYAVSLQLAVEKDGKEERAFLRGGLGILNKDGLYNLYKATETACIKAGIIPEENE